MPVWLIGRKKKKNLSYPNGHIYKYLSYPNGHIFENLFFPNRVVLRLICVREREKKNDKFF
jgi:hypothetical protein